MIFALSAEGTILNYHEAYRYAWSRAFGGKEDHLPKYLNVWNVSALDEPSLARLQCFFDQRFWSLVSEFPGARQACTELRRNNISLHAITTGGNKCYEGTHQRLKDLNFPIDEIHIVEQGDLATKQIAHVIKEVKATVFVDQNLSNFRLVSDDVHKALIAGPSVGNSNTGFELATVDSSHPNLSSFVEWWLSKKM